MTGDRRNIFSVPILGIDPCNGGHCPLVGHGNRIRRKYFDGQGLRESDNKIIAVDAICPNIAIPLSSAYLTLIYRLFSTPLTTPVN
jgi:hypothetical protein